jgi:hypothetical protein
MALDFIAVLCRSIRSPTPTAQAKAEFGEWQRARTIAKWLFFIAIAIFAVFLVMGLLAGEVLF